MELLQECRDVTLPCSLNVFKLFPFSGWDGSEVSVWVTGGEMELDFGVLGSTPDTSDYYFITT